MGFPKTSIKTEQLKQLIGTPECPVIFDVRRNAAFDESERMIATAEWRDNERAAHWAAGLQDSGAVVVYCVHGHEVSQDAAQALRSAGIDAVFLEGGIEAFIEDGGKTVTK